MSMQSQIPHLQSLYREYLALHAQDEAIFANLKRRQAIMAQLEQFYESKWREYYEAIENGADIDLTTEGEYSIMSQDALWDAFCEDRAFYEKLLALTQQALDKPLT